MGQRQGTGDINVREKELELLLEQRQVLVDDIKAFVAHQFTFYFAVLTFIGVVVPVLIQQQEGALPLLVVFWLVEVVIILVFLIYGILTAMNCDRDYVRAIDQYIREEYGITKLFYQGELLFLHINKMSSPFAKFTFFAGIIGGIIAIVLLYIGFMQVLSYYQKTLREAWYMFVAVAVEIIVFIGLLIKNMKYKTTGESKNYTECLHFLREGNYAFAKPQRRVRRKKR